MAKKIALLILVLALVGILAVAGILYKDLSGELAPDQLAVQTQPSTEPITQPTGEAPETTAATTEHQPMLAPDFTVFDREGNSHKLSDFFGKPIVLNFWASWCGPCKMEMPDFNEKYQELGEDIQFLMINMTDGDRETVEIASEFVAGQGYSFPVFYDTAQHAAMVYGVYSLPTTFFIDAEGYPVAYAAGAINSDALQQGIDMIR